MKDNIVYQDNMSTMKLENNERALSGKKTRHINIRYYFVTDWIKKGDLKVMHCPIDLLLGDFYTKPLQGKKFRIFRNIILNLDDPEIDNFIRANKITEQNTRKDLECGI